MERYLEKILIIDDDKEYCDILENTLSLEGFRAESVFNGEEALFRSKKAKVELIDHVIERYLSFERSEKSEKVIEHIRGVLSEDLNAEELFHFLGPTLTSMALQFPAEEYPTETRWMKTQKSPLGTNRFESDNLYSEVHRIWPSGCILLSAADTREPHS